MLQRRGNVIRDLLGAFQVLPHAADLVDGRFVLGAVLTHFLELLLELRYLLVLLLELLLLLLQLLLLLAALLLELLHLLLVLDQTGLELGRHRFSLLASLCSSITMAGLSQVAWARLSSTD